MTGTDAPDQPTVCSRCGDFADHEPSAEERTAPWICSSCIERLAARRASSLKAERSLRRISTTFYVLSLLGGATMLAGVLVLLDGVAALGLGLLTAGVVAGAATAITGFGLSRLKTWAVWTGLVLSVPLLAVFPLGTLAGGEAIWTLLRHRDLATAEYREIVQLTPEQTPKEVKTWQIYAIAILLLVIAGYVVWAVSGS